MGAAPLAQETLQRLTLEQSTWQSPWQTTSQLETLAHTTLLVGPTTTPQRSTPAQV